MKRIIYFVLAILVCGIYVGCSENEIDLYDQTPRINFYGSTTHVRTLVDTDYVKKEPYAVDSFEVRIQGDFLKENRDFCVKVSPNIRIQWMYYWKASIHILTLIQFARYSIIK